jgi:hypothetical protein
MMSIADVLVLENEDALSDPGREGDGSRLVR